MTRYKRRNLGPRTGSPEIECAYKKLWTRLQRQGVNRRHYRPRGSLGLGPATGSPEIVRAYKREWIREKRANNARFAAQERRRHRRKERERYRRLHPRGVCFGCGRPRPRLQNIERIVGERLVTVLWCGIC